MPELLRAHTLLRIAAAAAAVAILLGLILPAIAAPLTSPDAYPKVAFVARNDNPFDAMAVGPVAGALGGIIVITPSAALSDAARDALVAFAPELVIIAGGAGAISEATAGQIDAAGPWTVRRASGSGRDQTAAEVAKVLDDLAVGRPVLTGGGQIVGDLHLGGTANLDGLTVQSNTKVANLNADLLDGMDSSAFIKTTDAVDAATLEGLPASAFALAGPPSPFEVEPNNTLATANVHPRSGPAYGSLIGADGTDHWRIEHGGGELTIRALTPSCSSGDGGDPYLRLYDSQGTQVAFDDDGDSGLCAIISGARPAGTYTVQIAAFHRVPWYTLSVEPLIIP